jgi:Phosphoenolpyruvate carboxykinase
VTPYGTRTYTNIAIDFTKKIILIGNSSYAGEMKKSVFATLNCYLPARGVMSGRRAARFLDLLRRAVPATAAGGVRQLAARVHCQAQGRLLAGHRGGIDFWAHVAKRKAADEAAFFVFSVLISFEPGRAG